MGNLQGILDPVLHWSVLLACMLLSTLYMPTLADNNHTGRLNQSEFSQRIDPIITSPNGEKEHLHNQLLAALYANVTRELPDPGLAPWVSANDKPAAGAGSKPVSGDAAERRLKAEVMTLPNRDRRRIKDLQQNEVRNCPTIILYACEHTV